MCGYPVLRACKAPHKVNRHFASEWFSPSPCDVYSGPSCLADQDRTTHQTPKSAWQGHVCQALVKIVAICQGLKTTGQGHLCQALVKLSAKCQGLKTTWQGHVFQALIEIAAKCQGLKTTYTGSRVPGSG